MSTVRDDKIIFTMVTKGDYKIWLDNTQILIAPKCSNYSSVLTQNSPNHSYTFRTKCYSRLWNKCLFNLLVFFRDEIQMKSKAIYIQWTLSIYGLKLKTNLWPLANCPRHLLHIHIYYLANLFPEHIKWSS